MSDQAGVVARAAEAVRSRLDGRAPSVAIVLGSGLGGLAGRIGGAVRVSYDRIPGFPLPTVEGHHGELVVGELGGRTVLAQSGRFHLYEGHEPALAALPVRVFAALGVRTLVVTNAAGGVRTSFAAGTIMLISDQLNLTGRSSLVGPVLPGEQRFPDMSAAYDPGLRALARRTAAELGIAIEEGVYAGLLGPSYETPAEVRMLGTLGADAVGMSTVLEVIAARSLGLRCLGFSLVTNPGAGLSPTPLSHQEVMETAGRAGTTLARLIERVLSAEFRVLAP
ncbi:MAG: purine-nucleoside phosphorylase [Gemmatimonadales bacterium]